MTKNRAFAVIVLFLMLTMAFTIMPMAHAHSPAWSLPTYMYVNVSPNPIGVGQTSFVNFWVNCPPPTATAQYGDRWHNLTIVVKAPDGTTQTLGPFTSDSSGGTTTTYTPTKVGNYTFQSFFGGQTLTNENPAPPLFPGQPPNIAVGDYFGPSYSSLFTLTVQEEAVGYPPATPLPTTYWTRPIYAQNSNWYSIGGNWLGFGQGVFAGVYNNTGNYNPYTEAPTTAHILWTKPEAFGGTIGGEFGGSEQGNYYATAQYEVKFCPVIINGILYYTEYPGSIYTPTNLNAVDLRTGKTIWANNGVNYGGGSPTQSALTASGVTTVLSCGQVLNYVSPNQYGGLAYLWTTGVPVGITTSPGTTAYNMFDAMTGKYILSVVNAPAGFFGGGLTMTEDEQGSLIGYYINSTDPTAPTLVCWNSTLAIFTYGFKTGLLLPSLPINNAWTWRPPQGGVIPFSDGVQWAMPLATNISGAPITLTLSGIASGVILFHQYGSTGGIDAFQAGWIIEAGYSAATGQLLWGPVNRTEPPNTRVSFGSTGNGNTGSAIGDGAWVECNLNTLQVTGYNLFTGNKLWGPKDMPNANPFTSLGISQVVANDVIYIWTYGGDVYAFKIQTGDLLWQYHSRLADRESPYGIWPLWTGGGKGLVAGGLLFVPEGHEFSPPLFHDAQQLALNITTGEVVWNVTAFNVNGVHAIADGVMTALNAYDNQIYAYGKGPSRTTVTAPAAGVSTSTPVTISGTVTDVSAGSQQQAVAANFPNGLPCVSDESQSHWMEYVYMQQPRPATVTGVPIRIDVWDSNNNYRTIGTVTSDASGFFSYMWTPDIPGKYTVIATFDGSGAYYGSYAEAAFSVMEAPEPTVTPTAPPASNAEMYITGFGIAIIAAIAIVGIALALMLRKR